MKDINNANTVKTKLENIDLFKKIHNTPINIKNKELYFYTSIQILEGTTSSLLLFYVFVKKNPKTM